MADGIRIDQLPTTDDPSLEHEVPAMRGGISVKLPLEEIRALFAGNSGFTDFWKERLAADADAAGALSSLGGVSKTANFSDIDDPDEARSNLGAVSKTGDEITGPLSINTTTGGLTISRLTTTQRNAIGSPSKGLIIYNTDVDDLQVFDGSAWLSALALGVGQTWQDVTASRSVGTSYVNNTGRPIAVAITLGSNVYVGALTVDGVSLFDVATTSTNVRLPTMIIVQPGSTYRLNQTSGTVAITRWTELR